jgi:hypothetical protein
MVTALSMALATLAGFLAAGLTQGFTAGADSSRLPVFILAALVAIARTTTA